MPCYLYVGKYGIKWLLFITTGFIWFKFRGTFHNNTNCPKNFIFIQCVCNVMFTTHKKGSYNSVVLGILNVYYLSMYNIKQHLALNTLASVCKLSILFSINFLWCWQRIVDNQELLKLEIISDILVTSMFDFRVIL